MTHGHVPDSRCVKGAFGTGPGKDLVAESGPAAGEAGIPDVSRIHVDLRAAPCRPSWPRIPAGRLMADEIGHLPRRPGRILLATKWSMQGLRAAWLHESSFRLEIYLLAVLAPVAVWLGQGAIERVLLIGSCLVVLGAELLNSAIEAVIERYGAEHHELAGRAKDMGSAAVFVLMVNVVFTWVLILGPRYLWGGA
jgi:diacylglycerol kinase (ATP)